MEKNFTLECKASIHSCAEKNKRLKTSCILYYIYTIYILCSKATMNQSYNRCHPSSPIPSQTSLSPHLHHHSVPTSTFMHINHQPNPLNLKPQPHPIHTSTSTNISSKSKIPHQFIPLLLTFCDLAISIAIPTVVYRI